MEFGASHLAAILFFALIPVLIYLLFKRRYRRQELGTMTILLRAYRKIGKLLRIKEMILLVLRTAAMLAFLAALLQPLLSKGAGDRKTHLVFAFDSSLSMRMKVGETNRFKQAVEHAKSTIESSGRNTTVSVFVFDDKCRPQGSSFMPVTDALRLLDSLSPGFGGTNPFSIARPLLDEAKRAGEINARCEVFVLSDFAVNSWTSGDGLREASAKERFTELSDISTLTFVDCALGHKSNRAINSIRPTRGTFCVGLDTMLHAAVSYSSPTGGETAVVSLERDNEAFGQRSADVAAGEQVTCAFPDRPLDEGPHYYRVFVEPDELAEDDQRFLAADVRRKIDVLIVDGRPDAEKYRSASGFAETALAPSELRDLSPLAPRVISLADLESDNISLPSVVILCDPPALSKRAGELLAKFVASGGGLLVALGQSARLDLINESLGGKTGFLPASLVSAHSGGDNDWLGIDRLNLPEPLEGMGALWKSGMKRLKIFSFVEATPHEDSMVLLALSGGKPLLISRSVGKGKCMLWTSSFDGEWTNLPALPMFPPLLHELVFFLTENERERLNLTVGESINLALPLSDIGGAATLYPPEGDELELRPTLDGEPRIEYGPLTTPGIYRLQLASGRLVLLAANPPHEESDTEPLTERALRKLLDGVSFKLASIKSADSVADERPKDLVRLLILIALGLLILETVLASIFSAPPKTVNLDFSSGAFGK